MEHQEYYINSIHDLIEVGTKLFGGWYRGHSREYNNLKPKLWRGSLSDLFPNTFLERHYIWEFQRMAIGKDHNLPELNDHLHWLFYLQHHGLPTRLLDWTKSILIAAYFATKDVTNENGELWYLNPIGLNKLSGIEGIPLYHHPKLKFLAYEIAIDDPKEIRDRLKLKENQVTPLAIDPIFTHQRISSQQSCFTIHSKELQDLSIVEIDTKYLTRYIIPSWVKPSIRKDLLSLGIRHEFLFPDLDGIAKGIKQSHDWIIKISEVVPPKIKLRETPEKKIHDIKIRKKKSD